MGKNISSSFKIKLMCGLVVLLAAILLFRPNFLEVENGQKVFVFHQPGAPDAGGSVGADLQEQLRERHGPAADCSFFYLGRDLRGTMYIYCIVDTPGESLRYIGVDDGDAASEKRAEVLWGTLDGGY